MGNTDLDLFGRKSFFIEPTDSLISEKNLSEFIENGFETYIVKDDSSQSLKEKVHAITSLFPEAILFFNIDAKIPNVYWQQYLSELKKSVPPDVILGAFCGEKSAAEAERLKMVYAENLRLGAGFLLLKENSEDNFSLIRKSLSRCGARGRRNWVRAQCDSTSTASFSHKGTVYRAKLLDVNETHFSCHIENIDKNLGVFDKVRKAHLLINGLELETDAVLIMRRLSSEENLCIFMFIDKNDSPALESGKAEVLKKKISEIVINQNMARLNESVRNFRPE